MSSSSEPISCAHALPQATKLKEKVEWYISSAFGDGWVGGGDHMHMGANFFPEGGMAQKLQYPNVLGREAVEGGSEGGGFFKDNLENCENRTERNKKRTPLHF